MKTLGRNWAPREAGLLAGVRGGPRQSMEDAARGRAMVGGRTSRSPDHHRGGDSPQPRQTGAETAEIGAILQAISRANGGGRIAADPKEDADCDGRGNNFREGKDAVRIARSSGKHPKDYREKHGARSQ